MLINPRSGDGRRRADLASEAGERGIEPVILEPDGDLPALGREMRSPAAPMHSDGGGDGSMAIVASIAAEHGVPFACIPAGTRNHFALDLGVRRDDVVGALDAFVDGVESRVDLGRVNDRPFVNNVSLGVYAMAVQDPGYREAKLRTLRRSARSLLSHSATAPGMSVVDDRGREHTSVAMMLVSNNPYALRRALGRSTRPALDGGCLGVVLVAANGGDRTWETPAVTAQTAEPAASAIDGEAVTLDPPLSFATDRVRCAYGSRRGTPACPRRACCHRTRPPPCPGWPAWRRAADAGYAAAAGRLRGGRSSRKKVSTASTRR